MPHYVEHEFFCIVEISLLSRFLDQFIAPRWYDIISYLHIRFSYIHTQVLDKTIELDAFAVLIFTIVAI